MNKNTTAILISFLGAMASFSATALATEDNQTEAQKYLRFEAVDDGKCHILSEGGKLMVMHTEHEEKAIKFRLIRYFADVRQQGRATGVAVPGEKPVKLGCTLVDGRAQHWTIERAHFEPN